MSLLNPQSIYFIPQEKPPIMNVSQEEIKSIRDQLNDDKDWIVIYEPGESTDIKYMFKASQFLYIR